MYSPVENAVSNTVIILQKSIQTLPSLILESSGKMVNRKITNRGKGNRGTHMEVKRMIKSMISAKEEVKFFNSTVASTLSATPLVLNITEPIIQGITGATRIGDEIALKKIIFKFRGDMNQSNTLLSNAYRFLLVADMQGNAAPPVVGDILTGTNVTDLYAWTVVKEKRFKIIYDKVFVLSLNGPSGNSFGATIPLKHHVFFSNVDSSDSSNAKGSLHLLVWDNLASNHVGVNGTIQVQFTDS
jgi:hypothetical protein